MKHQLTSMIFTKTPIVVQEGEALGMHRAFLAALPLCKKEAVLLVSGNDFIDPLFPDFLETSSLFPIFVLFMSIYLLSVAIFFYSSFVIFYLDMLVITNDRLLDIEQKNLFARSISEADLYQIQDVSSEVVGVFASLFNYGNLTIQTAGAVLKFSVSNVHDPDGLRQEILELAEADRKFHAGDGTNL
jgi:membrane protein YdbS with pleckstrin-like domain